MLTVLVFNVMIKAYRLAQNYGKACHLFEEDVPIVLSYRFWPVLTCQTKQNII
jgi:pentatricopeptide repeat protein